MKDHSYLTFQLCDRLCSISVTHVEEVFSLPELTQISEASHGLIGTVNLRGEILPILDLNVILGYPPLDYRLTDKIVVLKQAQVRIGIIVNQVHGIKDIASGKLTIQPSSDQQFSNVEQSIIAGIAINEEIFILNDPEEWIRCSEIQQEIARVDLSNNETDTNTDYYVDELRSNNSQSLSIYSIDFYSNMTLQERAILRERANNLRQPIESKPVEELNSLAVITLNNELFGVDLKFIKGFIDVRQVTPIPCCPPHFVGNVNFRGEILTLVNIYGLLNLPPKKFVSPAKVMIVEIDSIVAGIVIDGIRDAMFLLNPQEITTASDAIDSIHSDHLQGTVPYQDQSMYVLDLSTLFLNELIF